MPGSTIATNQALYQIAYENFVNEALPTHTTVWNELEDANQEFTGRYTSGNVRRRRAQGFSIGMNAVNLPSASSSRNEEYRIDPTMWAMTLRADWSATHSSASHAYMSTLENDMVPATESAIVAYNRMAMGDGTETLGVVASVTSVPGAPLVFTVTGLNNLPFHEEGQRVEFMTSVTAASKKLVPSQGYYEYDSIGVTPTPDPGTLTITCTAESLHTGAGAAGPAANDVIVVHGAIALGAGAGGGNATNAMNGLRVVIDDGNAPLPTTSSFGTVAAASFQNINATSNYWWQSKTVDGTGNYFNLRLAHRVMGQINQHGSGLGGQEIQFIVFSEFQRDQYLLSLYPQERYQNTGAPGKFTAGSPWMTDQKYGPMVGNVKTLVDRFCPDSIAYFVGPGIKKYVMKKPGFYTDDGLLWRPIPGQPAEYAVMYAFQQIGAQGKRNRSGRIENLNVV